MNERVKRALGPVQPDEQIDRYIFIEKYIRPDNTIKGPAFRETREGEFLSVSRTSTLNEAEILALGRATVAFRTRKEIIGWGRLSVREAENNSFLNLTEDENTRLIAETPEIERIDEITIEVKDTPYEENPYHADITYEPFVTSIMKHLAKKLAKSALFIPPS